MKILRVAEVIAQTGISRVTIWRLEREGKFPRRIQLSEHAIGWLGKEIDAWVQSRPRVHSGEGSDIQ